MKKFAYLVVLLLSLFSLSSVYAAGGEGLKNDPAETWGWRTAMATSLVLTLLANPLHADEYSVSLMNAEDVAGFKVGFRWHASGDMGLLKDTGFSHYYHLGYNYWQSTTVGGQEGVNSVLEFIPVFRYSWSYTDFLSYLETSVGVSVFSRSELNDRQFSTNFQFANGLAFGGYFSPQTSWSFQLQHYSNNSIKLPNNGINFFNFNVAYRY